MSATGSISREFRTTAWPSARLIATGTALCGTLDIAYAIVLSVLKGGTALGVLHSVASGPFGDAVDRLGWTGGLLGLVVHFSIMAVMVGVFCSVVSRWPRLNASPLLSGTVYGVVTYLVMYWIVLAVRWPERFPTTDPAKLVRALLPHLACVGIPLAYLARSARRAGS